MSDRWPVDKCIAVFHTKYAVDPVTGCWNWLGSLSVGGYARFGVLDVYYGHRFAWLYIQQSPIQDGLQLDHLCRNRKCVNPQHLELVTSWENTLRGNNFTAVQGFAQQP